MRYRLQRYDSTDYSAMHGTDSALSSAGLSWETRRHSFCGGWFTWLWHYIEKEKKYRTETSRNAFWNAVRQEKETGIREVVFRYRQDNPPNDLSEEEKRNWCDQAFLLTEDPDRVRLDHSIKQLKGLVSALDIGIHSVRGKGYRMSFPAAEDAPKIV